MSSQGGVCLGVLLPGGVCLGGVCLGGCLPKGGVSAQEGCLPGGEQNHRQV